MGLNSYNLKLMDRLFEVETYFTKKEYLSKIKFARELFEQGQFDKCQGVLDKFPSREKLLERLIKKLEGKSVSRTLKKIQEGKTTDDLITAKGLSSLLTHICIELEKGNTEYKILVPNIIEKLNEAIYATLKRG